MIKRKKQNILFAINNFTYGGIQTQALALAKEFKLKGANIYFLWTDKFEDEFVKTELKQNDFKIINGQFINNQYLTKISWRLNRYITLIKVIFILRFYRINYVIPYQNKLCYFFGAIHPYTSAKKTIFHIRNTVFENKPIQSWYFRKALNNKPLIIANSNHARIKFKKVYGKMYKFNIVTIHNGIKLRNIDLSTNWKLIFEVKDYDYIVTSLANFFHEKDYLTIFKAWSIFIKKIKSKAILVIAGEEGIKGSKNRYQLEINKLGIQNYIRFIGRTPHNLELLSISNCNILSTLNEGLPNSVIETLGMNIPFIGTKVDGIEEVVGKKYPIPRFNIGDYKKLAETLFKLYNKEFDLQEIKTYSSNRYKKFLIDEMVKKYSEYITI